MSDPRTIVHKDVHTGKYALCSVRLNYVGVEIHVKCLAMGTYEEMMEAQHELPVRTIGETA